MRSVALGPKRARGGVALIFTAAECKPASLTVGLRENDSDAWSPIQQWLLQLRRRGLSVLNVHHAGKTGGQRGSADKFTQSAYADCYAGIAVNPRFRGDRACADRVNLSAAGRARHLVLPAPAERPQRDGGRFEVHIEKARGIRGELVLPFEARLETRDGRGRPGA